MNNNLKPLLIFFMANLIARLLLLNWHGAEYTDGIIMMSGDLIGKSKWLPLYPLAIQLFNLLFNNLELSGRLVSSLSASLTIFPLFFISYRLCGKRAAYYTILLYSCSAIVMRWSLHVMSESTFTLFFLLSVWSTVEFAIRMNKTHLMLATIFSAISALTRPEGIIMLPVLAFLYSWQLYKKGRREFAATIWSALSWGLFPLWNILVVGSFLYGEKFSREASSFDWSKFATFLTTYIDTFPYILGYPLFALALIGSYHFIDKDKIWFLLLSIYFGAVWVLVYSAPWGWTTRYLYSLVPLALVLSAVGIEMIEAKFNLQRTKAVIGFCIVYSVIFLGAVLYFQRDSFGDIKRSSLFLKNNLQQKKVFSDELQKTGFWSDLKVLPYSRSYIKAGDYVVLHSFYTNLNKELIYLSQNYQPQILYSTKSWLVPLLSDDLIMPSERGRSQTNSPSSVLLRFTPQIFESVVINLR